MYYTGGYDSPLGRITLACDEKENLVGLWMEGQKYFLGTLPEEPVYRDDLSIFTQTRDWLERYFSGNRPDPKELPLAPIGGNFRQEVWGILREIPYGQIMTYGEIARTVAARRGLASMSGQAVGGAVGHNPISIVIPCHRVVGTGGSLTGYAGGIEKKIKLLELEGVDMSHLSVPKKKRNTGAV